ncbi:mitochondrial 2-oxoglutarate/malate carrier protein [Clonorchis sinensis]|nr:mitochondrial 2-oxoglutarate/malate carrier protein [Clonorchis sinensis]
MGRAAVVNGAQLASYSQTKQQILESGILADGIFVHFLASMFSGFVTSVFSLPVDIIKTRIQNMKYIDGKPEYSSMSDVFFQVVRKESVFSLWKGFTPYFFRLGPHTVLTFIFLEQLNRGYRIYVLGDTGDTGRHGGL